MPTAYELHIKKWENGCGSGLCSQAHSVCLGRGTMPAPLVFVGEAPGEAENSLGVPFCGPAGQLLDWIIDSSVPESIPYALTNLVGCIPRMGDSTTKASAPEDEDIHCCSVRLMDFLRLARPKLIVCVGKLSEDYLMHRYSLSLKLGEFQDTPKIGIVHPAFILRCPYVQQGGLKKRTILQIQQAVEKYLPELLPAVGGE